VFVGLRDDGHLRGAEMSAPHIRLGRILGAELARVAGRPAKPPAAAPPRGTAQWAQDLLGLSEAQIASRIFIQAAWKARLTSCHHDAGGSDEAAREAGLARDILLARLET